MLELWDLAQSANLSQKELDSLRVSTEPRGAGWRKPAGEAAGPGNLATVPESQVTQEGLGLAPQGQTALLRTLEATLGAAKTRRVTLGAGAGLVRCGHRLSLGR